jgi:tetrahydromethanopterin S-methyltransferase subunit G
VDNDARIISMLEDHGRRFEAADQRFEAIDRRLDGIDRRLDGHDERLDGLDRRLDETNRRISVLHEDVLQRIGLLAEGMNAMRESLEQKIEAGIRKNWEDNAPMRAILADHERRLKDLEGGPPSRGGRPRVNRQR